MDGKKKTAIILGATGLTGGRLLQLLINAKSYDKIKLFSRSSIGFDHPKMEEHIIDVLQLENQKSKFTADVVFCCIGTTKSKTPDKELYKKIDYGIPVTAAKLCKDNNIKTFIVISALGANSKSSIFYNRVKGEMEEAVLDTGIPECFILQPSLIGGKREEKRIGEWLFKQLLKVVNFVLAGPLEKYKSVHPENIAKTMLWLANNNHENVRIESDEIQKIARL